MASFDITSDINWHELENSVQQALKEIQSRFDFKGVRSEIEIDRKEKFLNFWCSEEAKLEAVIDVFQTKAVKRGISLLSFDFKEIETASVGSVKQKALIQAGISKEKAKEIIALVKAEKIKVEAQIQDEKVRVTSKSRDVLQECIQILKTKQDTLKIPMQFGNFRE